MRALPRACAACVLLHINRGLPILQSDYKNVNVPAMLQATV